MEANKKTTFIKGATILAIAGLICKVIGVLFRVYAGNIVDEPGMDFYEKVYPTYALLLIISSSGIPTAISRMVAERAAVGNYDGAKRVFRRSMLLLLLIGVVTSAFMFFGAQWIGKYILNGRAGIEYSIMALAPSLLFVSLICAFRGYLQGLQRMTGTSVSQLAEQVFKFIFGLLLAYLLFKRYGETDLRYAAGAAGILLGVTISEILALIVMVFFYLRTRKDYMAQLANPAPNEKVLGPMLAIAIPITFGASILPIANMLDSAMITRLLSGIGEQYAAIVKEPDFTYADLCYQSLCTYVRAVINLPATLTVGIAMSIVPAISAAHARKDTAEEQNLSLLSLKLSMAIGVPCAVGLCVLAGPIIQLLYHSYITPQGFAIAVPLMRVAAFTVIFISLVQTATGALQGAGKHRLAMYFLLIGGIVKIAVNLIFIPMKNVNILGGVLSNLSCFCIAGVLDTIALLRVTKARLNIVDTFIKPVIVSALMGAAAWGAHALLSRINSFSTGALQYAATVLAILFAIIVYIVLMILVGMFTKDELAYIPGGRRLVRFARK